MSNIIILNKPYNDEKALDDLIYYCINPKKCDFFFGYGVRTASAEAMISTMRYIKAYYRKTDGKQLYHMIFTGDSRESSNHEYTKMQHIKDLTYLNDIIPPIGYMFYKEGIQTCIFRHVNTDIPHYHFILNSVNYCTGQKLKDFSQYAYKLDHYLKEKCAVLNWKGVYFNDGKKRSYRDF